MRQTTLSRSTKETNINMMLSLEGTGESDISSGVAFFDHMLEAFARHSLFDLNVQAMGDLEVDAHHTVEDIGIVLGTALRDVLGDKQGIRRFGQSCVPMDEALVMVAIDISGRGQLHWDVELPIEFIGNFDSSLFKEFLIALCSSAAITMHVRGLSGDNSHHIIEAASKAIARALSEAVSIDQRIKTRIPSTKGVI